LTLGTEIVTDLAVIAVIAALVTYLFARLRQPLILGYLIAGMIIGPYTPPFSLISQIDYLQVGADLGVILLLFAVGLEFPLRKFRSVGKVSVGVAAIEICFMLLVSFGVAILLGWSLVDAAFLGTALASSSTTVIAKVLADLGKLQDESANVMLGVLVVEDLFVVLLLAILQSSFGTISGGIGTVGLKVAEILLFVVGSLAIGVRIVPRLVDRLARVRRDEVLLLISVGLAFALSVVGSLLGFSVAIGAFLMGIIVAGARFSDVVAELTLPLKHFFGAIFFVSVGALIDVSQFGIFLLPALIVTALMVGGKLVGCSVSTRVFGYSRSTSLKVGLGMAQIGEFAFIVMRAGQTMGLVASFLYPTVGVAAAITTFLTPYLIKLSHHIEASTVPTQKQDMKMVWRGRRQ